MKSLKKYFPAILLPILVLLAAGQNTFAANTFDWKGATSTSWIDLTNWSENGAAATTFPGQGGVTTDIVRVGVSSSVAVIANNRFPVIPNGVIYTIASLTFGNNNAPYSNTVGATLSLTIGSTSTLNVSGTVLQMHSATGGLTNSGGRSEATGGFTKAITTTINGPGTLHCNDLTVGDSTTPGNAYVNNDTWFDISGSVTITVDNNFTLNSASYHLDDDQTVISRNSDPFVSFISGTLTVTNQMILTNINPYDYVIDAYIPSTSFSIDQKTANATLNFGGADPLKISIGGTYYCLNYVDFYNASGSGGQSTVTFLSNGAQKVYNSQSYPTYALDQDPKMYQNVSFGGSGTKTFDIGTTTLSGNLTLNPGTEVVDLSVNTSSITLPGALSVGANATLKSGSGAITVTGAVTNAGTITLGSGNFSMANNFTNSGTFTSGTSTVIFNATGAVQLNDSAPGGTIFNNVKFTSGNNATLQSGTFGVSGTGVMTLSNTGTIVTASGANLIFKSDANGSATLAALPAGCQVSGSSITVERYIAGGAAARGYRLMSPSTYNATDSRGANIYGIKYLLNTTYVSGTAFDATTTNPNSKTGNPSMYLFRENLVPQFTTFLNSNYRGIESLGSDPYYPINLDSPDLATTYDIPVGNGYLFFFRGGLGTTNPFATGSTPLSGTLASTGTLNEGAISVTNWFNGSLGNTGLLYSTASGDPAVEGMNLVGNPYPSTIDWNTYTTTNNGTGIYGQNITGAIYLLNPGNQAGAGNFTSYIPGVGSNKLGYTGLIASGEGFFVQTLSTNSKLIFNETAKTNTQATGGSLFLASKQTLSAVKQQIRLALVLDSINTEEILINFNANAKQAFNVAEDARYKTGSGKIILASLSSDNISLAINQLPLAAKGDTIKLRVGASTSGTYTLKLETFTGIPQFYSVWLKDAVTKDSVDLRKTSSYSFSVDISDTTNLGTNRFSVILSQDPAMAYQLLSFDAEKTSNGQQAKLTWTTKNEADYTRFTVERSADNGKNFSVVGGITSTGQGEYGLADHNPDKGDNLYRLKQEDFGNNVTYSNLVNLNFGNSGGITRLNCFPNPAINNIALSFDPKSQGKTTYDIRITNSAGRVVRVAQVTDTNWHDNVSNLMTGTYLVQVTDQKNNSLIGQTKFVKL